MRPRLSPLEIILKDLPPEGRDFVYTRESGEMNGVLKDLIADNPYDIRLKLAPIGNAFTLQGEVKTAMNLQCSLCASDFKYLVQQHLNEIIVPQKPLGKGEHQSRANHVHELQNDGPDYILLETEAFNVGEYMHELIALAEPIRPIGGPACGDECGRPEDRIQREWLTFGEENAGTGIRTNPFQVLEKMKLKS
ncbi:MAG TPA: DUF177 domain-containing protein [Bdellovibrionales bacterium]|nr:DUF177 domain-containing protein [Bdellovibrionales bacterium]